jgi:hypothetical protein
MGWGRAEAAAHDKEAQRQSVAQLEANMARLQKLVLAKVGPAPRRPRAFACRVCSACLVWRGLTPVHRGKQTAEQAAAAARGQALDEAVRTLGSALLAQVEGLLTRLRSQSAAPDAAPQVLGRRPPHPPQAPHSWPRRGGGGGLAW